MSIDVTNLKAASAGTIAMALDAKDGKSILINCSPYVRYFVFFVDVT